MAIADDLQKLASDLSDAYDAIETKGGTLPEHKNTDSLPDAIRSIEGGGELPQSQYGRVWYDVSEWDTEDASECSVEVDNGKFTNYLGTNPVAEWSDGINFDYNSEEGTWQSWDFESPVDGTTTEQLAEQLGLTVTLDPGAEGASFRLAEFPTGEITYGEFTSSEYANQPDAWSPLVVGGESVPKKSVKKFEFGSVPTTIPDNFLCGCHNLEHIDRIPEGITLIGDNFLSNCQSFNDNVILPTSLVSIGGNFLENCTAFNKPLAFPEGMTSIGNYWLQTGGDRGSFNQPISFPDSLTSLGAMVNFRHPFNQPLLIPNNITRLDENFIDLPDFNQPIYLPQGLTSIYNSFWALNNMTSTFYVGNLSPSIVSGQFLSVNNRNYPSYTQGVKIIGANRQAWLNAFPNLDGPNTFRKLIDGGY